MPTYGKSAILCQVHGVGVDTKLLKPYFTLFRFHLQIGNRVTFIVISIGFCHWKYE